MPRYPDSLIEEICSRNDIVDVVGSYVKLKKTGSNYMGLCPFHSEKSPSFSVSARKQMYYCFGCHAGGNVITFVREYENYSFVEALRYLAERAGVDLPAQELSTGERKREQQRARILEIYKKTAGYYYKQLKMPEGAVGYRYFQERGLSQETILHFGLGYTGKSGQLYPWLISQGYTSEELKISGLFSFDETRGVFDKFWNRVMFPIMDVNNRVIAFGGRVMGDGKPKYLNSQETIIFDKSRNLFGLNYARSTKRKEFLLCEGYMDVISLHQAGFTNAVASLGTALTGLQANLVSRYTKEVVLTYDSDDAGIRAALRAIPILKDAGLTVKILDLQPCKDPDEFMKTLGKEEFEQRIDRAKPSFFFELDVEQRHYAMDDPEQKTKYFQWVAKKIAGFEDKLERSNYIEAVARNKSVRSEDLQEMVNRYGVQMLGQVRGQDYYDNQKEKSNGHKKISGICQSYSYLFTWLVEEPGLYPAIRPWLKPEDFCDDLYRQVAQMLFEQLDSGTLVPAGIINHFEDTEEQKLVAEIFHMRFEKEHTKEEKEKIINELFQKIKHYSLEQLGGKVTDMKRLQEIMQEKRNLAKVHIFIENG